MTLGNMRSLGVRSLAVTCGLCHHEAILGADDWSDAVLVSTGAQSQGGSGATSNAFLLRVLLDPGRMAVPRISALLMLRSTISTVSAPATCLFRGSEIVKLLREEQTPILVCPG